MNKCQYCEQQLNLEQVFKTIQNYVKIKDDIDEWHDKSYVVHYYCRNCRDIEL